MSSNREQSEDLKGMEGEMEGEEGRSSPLATNEKNPMMNHVVLARLFELCELPDLFRFRLVSKQWYSLSLPRFRHEVPHRIRDFKWSCSDYDLDFEVFEDDKQPIRCFHLSKMTFLSQFRRDLRLDSYEQDELEREHENREYFWGKYAAQIWKLELSTPKICCVADFKKRIFEDMSNLRELKLSLGHVGTMVEDVNVKEQLNLKSLAVNFASPKAHKLPLRWRSLFLHFPKIEKLELDLGVSGIHSFSKMVDSLEELSEEGGKNLIIKDLKLHHARKGTETATERLFKLPHFKLDSLWLEIRKCHKGKGDGIIRAILNHQGATLKKLTILTDYILYYEIGGRFQPWTTDFPFQTEPFSSLTEIELHGYSSPNCHFLEQTPNLKKLSLSDCYPNMVMETDWERMNNLTLSHLLHVQVNLFLSEEAARVIGKIMPNLKVLVTRLYTPAFRAVCENLKSLRELSVTSDWTRKGYKGEVIGDKGVTGIVEGYGDHRFPNITDLQGLEKLEMNTRGDLSDVSIWKGFLKLTKLKSLRVNKFKTGTSVEALNALYARFPDSRLA